MAQQKSLKERVAFLEMQVAVYEAGFKELVRAIGNSFTVTKTHPDGTQEEMNLGEVVKKAREEMIETIEKTW